MKKIILLYCLLSSWAYAVPQPPSSAQLVTQIQKNGAKSVIAKLYTDDEKEWLYVLEKIEKGNDDWLKIASLLAPGSDADSAESLATAVAMAIPHNPSGVLAILNHENILPLSTDVVCALPFYSITRPQFNQYIVDSIQALYNVAASKSCIDTMVNTLGRSNGFKEDN